MTTRWSFERVSPSNRAAALEALTLHFREVTPERYAWHFETGPAGPGLAAVALAGGRGVGFTGIGRRDMLWNGIPLKAGQASYLSVHRDYWGQGLFPRIIIELFRWADEEGYDLVYFFQAADVMSYPWFLKLGYRDLGGVPQFRRVLDPAALATRRWPGLLRRVLHPASLLARARFGARHASTTIEVLDAVTGDWLAAALPSRSGLDLVRDAPTLNHRYADPAGPGYEILGMRHEGREAGCCIVRTIDDGPVRRAFLMDMVAAPGRGPSFLAALAGYLSSRGVAALYAWSTAADPLRTAFTAAGFRPQAGVHGRILAWISPRRPDLAGLSRDEWRLAMGDSDLY